MKEAKSFVVTRAEFAAAADTIASLPAPVLGEVAFAGRSNVGKSTLMNAMMSRNGLVRTSKNPGATRSINFFNATVLAPPAKPVLPKGEVAAPVETPPVKAAQVKPVPVELSLIDLPGYGYARISKSRSSSWGPLIEHYFLRRPTLRSVVLLVDARRGPEEEERELLEFLARPAEVSRAKPLQIVMVATKTDKLARHEAKLAVSKMQQAMGVPVIGMSGASGEGRELVWKRLIAHLL